MHTQSRQMCRLCLSDGILIMKYFTASISLLALAALLNSAAAEDSSVLKQAGIVNGRVVAGLVGGALTPLTENGRWGSLPVISPNGMRIAFVEETDLKIARADIVVIAMDGRELSRTPIEPVVVGLAYAGMRYIEKLRWITSSRLVVSGSINPSTSQYYIVDTGTGKIGQDFTDDSSQPAFSPDGLHIVVLADSPHFAPQSEESPSLLLDDKPIWKAAKGTVLAAAPQFSPDGSSVAWAELSASGSTALDIWSDRGLHKVPLPVSTDSDMHVFWSGNRAVATASPLGVQGKNLAWSADANGADFTAQLPNNPVSAAVAMRNALASKAASAGVKDANFWCVSCALNLLPRSSQ